MSKDRRYPAPDRGSFLAGNPETPIQESFDRLRTDVVIFRPEVELTEWPAPLHGPPFLASDSGKLFKPTGGAWEEVALDAGGTYSDADAIDAINNDTDHGSTASHDYYTDSDAVSAINNDTDHGSTASHDYFSGSHDDLSGVSEADHRSDSNVRSTVNGSNIDIAGDADSVDGYDIQKNGTDGTGIINFKT